MDLHPPADGRWHEAYQFSTRVRQVASDQAAFNLAPAIPLTTRVLVGAHMPTGLIKFDTDAAAPSNRPAGPPSLPCLRGGFLDKYHHDYRLAPHFLKLTLYWV